MNWNDVPRLIKDTLPESAWCDCTSEKRDERYIGLNVYYIRKKVLHVSQEEFGYMMGMSKDTVSNIERGIYIPCVHTLVNIANRVNVPVEFFLHENKEKLTDTVYVGQKQKYCL